MLAHCYPYQKQAIKFCLEKGRAILAADMGLGKTLMASAAAQYALRKDPKTKGVLIICPPALSLNWANELRRFGGIDAYVIKKTQDVALAVDALASHTPWVVCPYTQSGNLAEALNRSTVQGLFLVCDEAHYLKNWTSQRSQAVLHGLKGRTYRRIFLTGTPIPNYPHELFPLLHSCDRATWPSATSFVERYCDQELKRIRGGYHKIIVGGQNLDELRERIRESCFYRITKEDCLDLPPKLRSNILIPLDPKGARVAKESLELLGSEDELTNLLSSENLATVRRGLALAKVPGSAHYLTTITDPESPAPVKKLVVFGIHTEALTKLSQLLNLRGISNELVTGSTPMSQRQAIVEEFQSPAGTLQAIVGNIQALGTGHTLTASDTVVFLEQSFTPGENAQAEDRIHRIGQTKNCNIITLCAAGSYDERVSEILNTKAQGIREAVDGR